VNMPSISELAPLAMIAVLRARATLNVLNPFLNRHHALDTPPPALGSPIPAEPMEPPVIDLATGLETESTKLFGEAEAFIEKLAPNAPTAALDDVKGKLIALEQSIEALVEPAADAIIAAILAKVPGGSLASPFAIMLLNTVLAKAGFQAAKL
jgi:hypothetical protein